MAFAQIPIYAQYYDEKDNVITKEVTHKDYPDSTSREASANVRVTENGNLTRINYYPSDIKFAAAQARRWAEANGLKIYFSTFILTTDAKPEWWTIQPKNSSFYGGIYSPETISMYKKQGFGVIIRDIRLPQVEVPEGKKSFTEDHIPF